MFKNEPRVPPELFTLDNVVLLPHVASGTHEARQALADRVFDRLQSYFDTGNALSAA
jgi:lactate dehydrogenase-like 2-hydroxyacid dehydrogenase